MPRKRDRRHFSQLSEFERGLIIEIKTSGWLTRRVAGQVDRSEKTTRRENQRIVRQALVDPTVTRSTIRADVGVAIVPQTISRHLAEANLKPKRPFPAIPLTPEHRQLRLQWCQARSMWNVTDWQKVVFSDESLFVLGKDDNRVREWRRPARVAQDFLRHFQTLPWPARSPDLSPVEHVWDHLKRQMPSCHSVHDLELAVQDLWAPTASGQHKVSNQLNAGLCGGMKGKGREGLPDLSPGNPDEIGVAVKPCLKAALSSPCCLQEDSGHKETEGFSNKCIEPL
ncbi:transposable element Tc1 transposase [Trichonephila clavipes]|nr:transposable element Tc1 transposase [Trichonephila clavipes]